MITNKVLFTPSESGGESEKDQRKMVNVKGNLRLRLSFQSLWMGLKSYFVPADRGKQTRTAPLVTLISHSLSLCVNNLQEPHSSESG